MHFCDNTANTQTHGFFLLPPQQRGCELLYTGIKVLMVKFTRIRERAVGFGLEIISLTAIRYFYAFFPCVSALEIA